MAAYQDNTKGCSSLPDILNTDSRKLLLFDLFLHVNRELDDFQRSTLKLVIGAEATVETVKEAITLLDQKALLLSRAGWVPSNSKGDQVQTPDHYDRLPMEPTFFIVTSGGYHWCIECFVKYVSRFRFKDGIQDLHKARRNLIMWAHEQAGDPRWSR
ncbi:DUF3310 domain-containing protein [Mesorhizobium sp. M0767]|uniref:DUF3310 domain-containing protein n=1 Tax=Mesorhizobium sp. M0767 TaxID=2956995 RepID=UPI0033365DDF